MTSLYPLPPGREIPLTSTVSAEYDSILSIEIIKDL
jgi:hypothetical protein